jgi:hypothetical protein
LHYLNSYGLCLNLAKNFDIGRAKDFLNTVNNLFKYSRTHRIKELNSSSHRNLKLMQHLNWRKENGMDTIHDEDWSDFTNDYYYNLDGTDREGRVCK